MSSYEKILVDLIHDLRQPLGNMEIAVWCLDRAVDPQCARAREHMVRLEQQLQQAGILLAEASSELARLRAERCQPIEAYHLAATAS
jgi:hypothetical protein